MIASVSVPVKTYSVPRVAVVAGNDLRYAASHLLRRLAEAVPAGFRAPEIIEASSNRPLGATVEFLVETDDVRVDLSGVAGVRPVEHREASGESLLEWTWSLDKPVWKGAYLRHGLVIAADEGRAHVLGPAKNLRIPGVGHLQAVLPAIAAALSWGVEPRALREIVFGWTGPAHSVQWAGLHRGATLFDDGACCTSEGLARALSFFDQKVTLVAGGEGFHAGFELLDNVCKGAGRIVLLPGTPAWIRQAWSSLSDVREATDLSHAAHSALECTPAGGQILYCPGTFPKAGSPGVTRRGEMFAEEFLNA
ncbi:MAG TPA: hypothetical protein PKO15_07155 [Fibrobacteria bacterium]|nr:hypothetical protein [Fibrobacteria bacterium]HOX53373.1 hypothetical protein [Fibrobacteria bacterium]